MQTRATQGLVPRRGTRSRKRKMSSHKALGASKGMCHGGASSGRLGCQGPGCAPASPKPFPVLLQDPSFPGCCHRSVPRRGTHLATSLPQAELWLEHFPNFPFAHTFKGRGGMGAQRAEPAALGRCCARSRGRPAKGNTNILPKESTFHQQHKFPFLHRAGLFRAVFPTTLPG